MTDEQNNVEQTARQHTKQLNAIPQHDREDFIKSIDVDLAFECTAVTDFQEMQDKLSPYIHMCNGYEMRVYDGDGWPLDFKGFDVRYDDSGSKEEVVLRLRRLPTEMMVHSAVDVKQLYSVFEHLDIETEPVYCRVYDTDGSFCSKRIAWLMHEEDHCSIEDSNGLDDEKIVPNVAGKIVLTKFSFGLD